MNFTQDSFDGSIISGGLSPLVIDNEEEGSYKKLFGMFTKYFDIEKRNVVFNICS